MRRWQAKSYSLHVVPQLRDSLINLVKPIFDVDSKEEKALYDRSLEVRTQPRLHPCINVLYFKKCK